MPGLLAALPTIASVIGGISGLTGIASNIKTMVTGNGVTEYIGTGKSGLLKKNSPSAKRIMSKIDKFSVAPPVVKVQGEGIISDLNIPIISPIAKMVGLGAKKVVKRRKKVGRSLYWK